MSRSELFSFGADSLGIDDKFNLFSELWVYNRTWDGNAVCNKVIKQNNGFSLSPVTLYGPRLKNNDGIVSSSLWQCVFTERHQLSSTTPDTFESLSINDRGHAKRGRVKILTLRISTRFSDATAGLEIIMKEYPKGVISGLKSDEKRLVLHLSYSQVLSNKRVPINTHP
jgi:hypothetical protein